MNVVSLKTQLKLSKLNNLLNIVKDVSFAYATLRQTNPIGTLDEEKAQLLIEAFEGEVARLEREIKAYKKEAK